jgi:hypothetical protein
MDVDGEDDEGEDDEEADAAPPAARRAYPAGAAEAALAAGAIAGAPGTQGSGINLAFLSEKKWADADVRLSPPTARALAEVFRFSHLSKVQAATLPLLLGGSDVFAKAKTGARRGACAPPLLAFRKDGGRAPLTRARAPRRLPSQAAARRWASSSPPWSACCRLAARAARTPWACS